VIADARVRDQLVAAVYDEWAEAAVQAGKWHDATAVYDRGLEQFPDDPHLTRQRDFYMRKQQGGDGQ
jgi:hypothetical protein